MVIVLVYEFRFGNHRSKPVFMMDISFNSCLLALNFLFVCKYQYFEGVSEMEKLVEEILTTIIYFMLAMLLLKLCWESFPWNSFCNLFQDNDEETEN